MPINPFRAPSNYDVPNFGPPQGRYDPSVFANIANIGESIGAYRDQQALSELAKGAVDPKTGQLDINKFVTANALAGRNPIAMMKLVEDMRHQREAEGIARTQAEAARLAAGRRSMQYVEPDPISGTPGGWRIAPDLDAADKGGRFIQDQPIVRPTPPVVAPQSAVPGGGPGNLAALDPENAPPYRVAGPPMPPPQQVAQAAPAVTAPADPLADLPETSKSFFRGAAEYKIDPYKIPFKDKNAEARFFGEMQRRFPGWSPDEYARREDARKKAEAFAETGPKAEQTKLGQERATIEAEAVKDAKAAADLQPLLDDITRSWEQLTNFRRFGGLQTGTGALAGSEAARLPQRALGTTEEQLRQGYERTLAALRAKITSTMNQGQGAVSNYERQMYNQIFPEFTTANPAGDLATLRQLQARNAQIANIGRETGLGKSAQGYLAERPAVERPQRQYFDAETAEQYRKSPDVTLNRARQLIRNGADPNEVREALRQIDPTLPGKL